MKKTWTASEEITAAKLNSSQLEQMEEYVLGENIAANSAVYLKASDGKIWKCDASFSDERLSSFIGFIYETGTTGQTKKVWIMGVASGFTGLTAGSEYYLSNTAGGIATSAGDNEKVVGIAVSATQIRIKNAGKNALTRKAQAITGIKTFGSIPLGPASDPNSDNQLARKKYIDDSVALGSWLSRSLDTVYEATTDGFVVARCNANSGYFKGTIVTDNSATPTTVRGGLSASDGSYGTQEGGCTVPVKSGDYWKVNEIESSGATTSVFWIPLGQ